jgi:hypothetical protein
VTEPTLAIIGTSYLHARSFGDRHDAVRRAEIDAEDGAAHARSRALSAIRASSESIHPFTALGNGHIHPYAALVNCFTMCARSFGCRAASIPFTSAIARSVSAYASHSIRARPHPGAGDDGHDPIGERFRRLPSTSTVATTDPARRAPRHAEHRSAHRDPPTILPAPS